MPFFNFSPPYPQRRNPLALAHYANHPPAGTPPNVMVAAVDWDPTLETTPTDQFPLGIRRAYVPVVNFCLPDAGSGGGGGAVSTNNNSTVSNTIQRAVLESERDARSLSKTTKKQNSKDQLFSKEVEEEEDEIILNFLPRKNDPAPCVALIALRDLKDEELFLNYRLNPNAPGGLPEWYAAVDIEEDARRWA